ncbi:MAG: hypothetical protein ACOYOQ_16060 [Microthrixaceae bacterium]
MSQDADGLVLHVMTNSPNTHPNPFHQPDTLTADTAHDRPEWAKAFERRLRLAVSDLSVGLPADWLSVDAEGNVSFAPLSRRDADRFVLAVESVLERLPALPSIRPQFGQLELFPAPATHLVAA